MTETATIYKDRDNSFTITMQRDSLNLTESEMDVITKYEIRYKDAYYDSDTYASAFDVSSVNASVTIKPHAFGLAGSSSRGDLVEFIIYDAGDYTNGLMWSQFYLVVKSDAALIV